MYRSLDEAAANCTRNIATGYGPLFSDRKALGGAAILTREEPINNLLPPEDSNPAACISNLVEALKDPECNMRVGAICTLAKLGPASKDAVPALVEALNDPDWVVRVAAITALGEIGSDAQEAVAPLRKALAQDDVCASATIALGRIGPHAKQAIPELTALAKSKSGFVRWCAEEALRSVSRF